MKIYASDNSTWWLPYLGKDIWVHCMWKGWNPVYIRIVETNYYVFSINLLEESDIEHMNIQHAFLHRTLPIHDFEPIYGADGIIETTTEISQLTAQDNAVFQKFAGKPWWIRGKNRAANVTMYLKVLEYDSGLMKVQTIYEGYVFDYEYEFDDSVPSRAIYTETIFADTFRADQPLDLLSDEEMDEILAENDKIFYQSYVGENGYEEYEE